MSELVMWQIISFISRGTAMAVGLLQSFFIVRLLTVGEWGTIQIALAIGGALGIYQHLGLASASTREISAAKDNNKEIFKIFVTSFLIRYIVSIPVAIGLFFLAPYLAEHIYKVPSIEFPLRLYALVLLIQGFQSILNSIISGTKRFKHLFIYQAAIAVVGLFIYLPLIFIYRINGYFYALVLFNLVSTITLFILAFKPLGDCFEWPKKSEFKSLFKELFSISLAIYLVKIIYTNWEKIGPNVLGLHLTPELVGFFSFALLYAKKIMSISDAVTDVNLPVFSDKFVHAIDEFAHTFSKNFDKLFILILFAASTAIYWSREIIFVLIGSNKYETSLPYILPLTLAFVFYSFINILKSSILIPAKMVRDMIVSFVFLIGGTLVFYFLGKHYVSPLMSMSYGMLAGATLGFAYMIVSTKLKLHFNVLTHDHFLHFTQCLILCLVSSNPFLIYKIFVYILMSILFVWGTHISKFFDYRDLMPVFNKLKLIMAKGRK